MALMMSYYRHSGVDEVTVTTIMNAVGCSYAEETFGEFKQ